LDRAGLRIAAPVSLTALAERHGGQVDAEAGPIVIRRIAPLDAGEASDLCPLMSRRHLEVARASRAALLVDAHLAEHLAPGRRWVHSHAAWALAGILSDLEPARESDRRADAIVEPGAEIAADVCIGPGAVIMAGARIGAGSVIEPNAVIYPRVWMGERVRIGASAVIGRPGFGWAKGPDDQLRRIPQLGGVVIEDDVEVGPLATVDAGTLGPTIVGRGVRLDAHVHVGHNVQMGPGTLVAAQSGFAGSVRIGAGVRVGGQAGVADHVRIGDGAEIAAKAGVIGDIAGGMRVAGYPALDRIRWLKGVARMVRRGKADK